MLIFDSYDNSSLKQDPRVSMKRFFSNLLKHIISSFPTTREYLHNGLPEDGGSSRWRQNYRKC